ncbi:hypothetical protein [Deinococcus koreensis]|uniref:Lipoprotein n=1 Tax=Deinococcus koreensis TaxID=2054903 RepID=A0A2K3UZN1_9DEIO|nr:hypothetical protein [Deinococcus koreensis]PNY82006.1 hypothetical protein CVO96_12075 [Deinococcus koreensis]
MRRLLLPLILSALSLAACARQDVKEPADYPLSGTISGTWGSAPRLRLALVGTGVPVAVSTNSAIPQNVVSAGAGSWTFGFDLPSPPLPNVAGVYQVVAFDDANNDANLNLGEPFARNRQWLVYSPLGGSFAAITIPEFMPGESSDLLPAMTVSAGWNLLDRGQPLGAANPRPVTKVTGYTISR